MAKTYGPFIFGQHQQHQHPLIPAILCWTYGVPWRFTPFPPGGRCLWYLYLDLCCELSSRFRVLKNFWLILDDLKLLMPQSDRATNRTRWERREVPPLGHWPMDAHIASMQWLWMMSEDPAEELSWSQLQVNAPSYSHYPKMKILGRVQNLLFSCWPSPFSH